MAEVHSAVLILVFYSSLHLRMVPSILINGSLSIYFWGIHIWTIFYTNWNHSSLSDLIHSRMFLFFSRKQIFQKCFIVSGNSACGPLRFQNCLQATEATGLLRTQTLLIRITFEEMPRFKFFESITALATTQKNSTSMVACVKQLRHAMYCYRTEADLLFAIKSPESDSHVPAYR